MADSSLSDVDQRKLREQIEFYFSTANLVRDKWLQGLIAAGDLGFVPLSEFALCQRVKCISTDVAAIANALKSSEFLALDPTGTQVRRAVPLDAEYDPLSLTVFVKPWPANKDLDETKKYFSQFGVVAAVWKRVYKELGTEKQMRKPSVFVEFEGADTAAKAVAAAAEGDGIAPYGERVIVQPKVIYLEAKKISRKLKKAAGGEAAAADVAAAVAERQAARAGKRKREEGSSDSEDDGEDEAAKKRETDKVVAAEAAAAKVAEAEAKFASKKELVAAGRVYCVRGEKVDSSITWQNVKDAFGGLLSPILFVRIRCGDAARALGDTDVAVHVVISGELESHALEKLLSEVHAGFEVAVEDDKDVAKGVREDALSELTSAHDATMKSWASNRGRAGGRGGSRGGGRGGRGRSGGRGGGRSRGGGRGGGRGPPTKRGRH